MTRTTPPRPVDVTALFPGLRAYAKTATRGHAVAQPAAPSAARTSSSATCGLRPSAVTCSA